MSRHRFSMPGFSVPAGAAPRAVFGVVAFGLGLAGMTGAAGAQSISVGPGYSPPPPIMVPPPMIIAPGISTGGGVQINLGNPPGPRPPRATTTTTNTSTGGCASDRNAITGGEQGPCYRQIRATGNRTPEPPPGTQRRTTPPPRFVLPAGERRFVQDEVLVQIGPNVTPAQLEAFEREFRLTRLSVDRFVILNVSIHRYRIPDRARLPQLLAALSGDGRVSLAQPNYLFETPKTTFTLAQAATQSAGAIDAELLYAAKTLRLSQAHQVARGDAVVVAVIDSAIDPNHPELAGALRKTVDVTGADGTAVPHEHGTGMAGAIAARAKLTGTAPAAAILGITAFRPQREGANGTTVSVLRAIDTALAEKARVLNMSFAGPRDPLLGRALAAARGGGLIMIAAAGNAGPKSPPLFPAADPNVIAVTATDADDKVFAQANRGGHILVAAPGVDVLVPGPDGSYEFTSGTSVAAAHVSGVVALLLERDPSLDVDTIRRMLTGTARDVGARGRDSDTGAGVADAFAAVQALGRGQPAAAARNTLLPIR